MLIEKDIPKNDKILLNALGKNADTPIDNLLFLTKYKRKSSVYKRIRTLKNQNYLYGPYYDINYNAIGTNKLFLVVVFAAYNPVHKDFVLTAMKKINCWIMIYPVRTADMYLGIYRCNNWNYIASLFKLMKKWGWLKEYSIHKSEHQWIAQNPDFFGDFIPSPPYQFREGELPHYHYEDVDIDFEFSETDLIVLKHLSSKTCHLTEIRDFEYYYFGLKLRYQTIKKSYERLKQSGILIKKTFIVFPLPAAMCSFFFLLSKGKNVTSHLRMITHFGDGLRLTKSHIITGDEVVSYFSAHPLLEGRILGMMEDKVDATMYGIKTYPSGEFLTQTFNDNYFDVDSQRWIFPYSVFKEKLKKIKDEL